MNSKQVETSLKVRLLCSQNQFPTNLLTITFSSDILKDANFIP